MVLALLFVRVRGREGGREGGRGKEKEVETMSIKINSYTIEPST